MVTLKIIYTASSVSLIARTASTKSVIMATA
jgi:hypothetical protein